MDRIDAMSSQMQDLGKQLEITQVSLDEVQKKQAAIPPTPVRPAVQVEVRESAPSGLPLLANKGAPLLPQPPLAVGQTISPTASSGFVTAPNSPTHHGGHHAKPPKHNFPKFSGENPRLWIDLCDTYFEMYQVQAYQWVCIAVLYMEGHAALWWQAYKRRHSGLTWMDFTAAVISELVPRNLMCRWPSCCSLDRLELFLSTG
jgi:hypothetical protein